MTTYKQWKAEWNLDQIGGVEDLDPEVLNSMRDIVAKKVSDDLDEMIVKALSEPFYKDNTKKVEAIKIQKVRNYDTAVCSLLALLKLKSTYPSISNEDLMKHEKYNDYIKIAENLLKHKRFSKGEEEECILLGDTFFSIPDELKEVIT